jgi:hypothetical protein
MPGHCDVITPLYRIHNKQRNTLTQNAGRSFEQCDQNKDTVLWELYVDRSDPIVFLPVPVTTSGRVYDDFVRLFFFHTHRESSILTGELPEEAIQESDQFRFSRAAS